MCIPKPLRQLKQLLSSDIALSKSTACELSWPKRRRSPVADPRSDDNESSAQMMISFRPTGQFGDRDRSKSF